ncbi:4912_t:CDS:2 [Funneliformis mosseae]|uniref:4912_t:CDS:1 n=1 Tax=Funneliformis mosseae TaxID=27381 RepID=A0A9N8VGR4_FUNMO|nr:4912_t:CDS:2 [Funneliformis mosseae]
MIEDRIILNVGGIKYETFRSTLTAYPDTLLGIMFSERNKEMLHPTNVNEYFFDRDGGRMDNFAGFGGTSCPTLPFTRAELEQELLFFLIPTKSDDDLIESLLHEETSSINSTQSLTFANKAVVDNVNGFLYALKEVMYCVASLFEKKIMITFYHDRQQPIFKLIPPNPNIIVNELAPFNEKIKSILIPYAGVGYTLLMNFENEIEAWMKEEIKELKWTMEKPGAELEIPWEMVRRQISHRDPTLEGETLL